MRLSLHRDKPGISLTWHAAGAGNENELWAQQLIILSWCMRGEDDWRCIRDAVIVSHALHRAALFVCILAPGGRSLAPPLPVASCMSQQEVLIGRGLTCGRSRLPASQLGAERGMRIANKHRSGSTILSPVLIQLLQRSPTCLTLTRNSDWNFLKMFCQPFFARRTAPPLIRKVTPAPPFTLQTPGKSNTHRGLSHLLPHYRLGWCQGQGSAGHYSTCHCNYNN